MCDPVHVRVFFQTLNIRLMHKPRDTDLQLNAEQVAELIVAALPPQTRSCLPCLSCFQRPAVITVEPDDNIAPPNTFVFHCTIPPMYMTLDGFERSVRHQTEAWITNLNEQLKAGVADVDVEGGTSPRPLRLRRTVKDIGYDVLRTVRVTGYVAAAAGAVLPPVRRASSRFTVVGPPKGRVHKKLHAGQVAYQQMIDMVNKESVGRVAGAAAGTVSGGAAVRSMPLRTVSAMAIGRTVPIGGPAAPASGTYIELADRVPMGVRSPSSQSLYSDDSGAEGAGVPAPVGKCHDAIGHDVGVAVRAVDCMALRH